MKSNQTTSQVDLEKLPTEYGGHPTASTALSDDDDNDDGSFIIMRTTCRHDVFCIGTIGTGAGKGWDNLQ
jgi:hypothetical protein